MFVVPLDPYSNKFMAKYYSGFQWLLLVSRSMLVINAFFFNVLPLVGVENQLKFQFHLPCATHVSIRSDNLKLIIRHKFKLPPTLLPP